MLSLRPIEPADREWIREFLVAEWGSPVIVSRGRIHQADEQPGFVAEWNGRRSGLLTYHHQGSDCEITTITSREPGRGIGRALIGAAKDMAARRGCRRLWLITTNDNTPALRFYQKLGFRLAALYPGAVEAARRLKPEIPRSGIDGIPVRDEIELDIWLTS